MRRSIIIAFVALFCAAVRAHAVPMGTGTFMLEVQGDPTNNITCSRSTGFVNQAYDVFGTMVISKFCRLHCVVGFLSRLLDRRAQSSTSRFTSKTVPFSSSLRGKYPTTGSFSQIGPLRLPATKQVETWTSLGFFIIRASLMMLFEPTTFVRSADSRGGLNVTLPAPLMMMSVSSMSLVASVSSRPR